MRVSAITIDGLFSQFSHTDCFSLLMVSLLIYRHFSMSFHFTPFQPPFRHYAPLQAIFTPRRRRLQPIVFRFFATPHFLSFLHQIIADITLSFAILILRHFSFSLISPE